MPQKEAFTPQKGAKSRLERREIPVLSLLSREFPRETSSPMTPSTAT